MRGIKNIFTTVVTAISTFLTNSVFGNEVNSTNGWGVTQKFRYESFCYGPKSCKLYKMGKPRAVHIRIADPLMPEATLELPYDGAREMLLVKDIENKEFLKDLLEAMVDALPAPKKKKSV